MSRYAVLGQPIAHSMSPVMHTAAFASLGLDHQYVAVETAPAQLVHRLGDMSAGKFAGLNLTVPLKQRASALLDWHSAQAGRIGAVNTVRRGPDGRLEGHNTDAPGFGLGLAGHGIQLEAGMHALILGGGGAARAIAAGLLAQGLALSWVSRSPSALPLWPGSDARSWPELMGLEDVELVVNATTVGMEGGPSDFPVPLEPWLRAWQPTLVDVVYPGRPDGLVARARRVGCSAVDGRAMLWGQGVLALELWLGASLGPGARRAMAEAIGLQNFDLSYM